MTEPRLLPHARTYSIAAETNAQAVMHMAAHLIDMGLPTILMSQFSYSEDTEQPAVTLIFTIEGEQTK